MYFLYFCIHKQIYNLFYFVLHYFIGSHLIGLVYTRLLNQFFWVTLVCFGAYAIEIPWGSLMLAKHIRLLLAERALVQKLSLPIPPCTYTLGQARMCSTRGEGRKLLPDNYLPGSKKIGQLKFNCLILLFPDICQERVGKPAYKLDDQRSQPTCI